MKSKQKRIIEWSRVHPVAACAVLVLLFVIFRKGLYFIFAALPQTTGLRVIHEILDVIWPFGLAVLFSQTDAYKGGRFFRTLLAGLVLLLLSTVLFAINVFNLSQEPGLEWYPLPMIALGVFTAFAVGFREESVYRGIAVNILADKYLRDRRGIFITTFVSAAFFGIMHMSNMLVGQSFSESIIQSVNAFFMGIMLAAIYLRGGNLWAVMLIHGYYDLAVDVPTLFTKTYGVADLQAAMGSTGKESISAGEIIVYAVLFSVYLLITLFLLRRSKCEEIIRRFERLHQQDEVCNN